MNVFGKKKIPPKKGNGVIDGTDVAFILCLSWRLTRLAQCYVVPLLVLVQLLLEFFFPKQQRQQQRQQQQQTPVMEAPPNGKAPVVEQRLQ